MFCRRSVALLVCLFTLAACKEDGASTLLGGKDAGRGAGSDAGSTGGEGGTGQTATTGSDGGQTTGNTPTDGGSTGGDASSDATADGSTTTTTGGDAGPYRDPSTIVGIRKPTVKCGDEVCEGTTQVCCDQWTETGWGTSACVEKDECPARMPPWATENDVRSECDGPRDCGNGNADDPIVCCFILQSAPHDVPFGTGQPGPGLGRECLRKSACLADGIADAEPSEGMPRGLISCTEDAHCKIAGDGLSCQPEADDDESAGGIGPRAWVSLCK